MLSCVPAHHYPPLHSVHSDSEQRKWLSDITAAPVSAAVTLLRALCARACTLRAVGYVAELAHSTTSTWPPDYLHGHHGHVMLHRSSKKKGRPFWWKHTSDCFWHRLTLCWFCMVTISHTSESQPTIQGKSNIHSGFVLSLLLVFEWVSLWSFVGVQGCGLRASTLFNGVRWAASLIPSSSQSPERC